MKESNDKVLVIEDSSASVSAGAALAELVSISGSFEAECFGPSEADREAYVELRDDIAACEQDDSVSPEHVVWLKKLLSEIPLEKKWTDTIKNTVVTVGKNKMLDEAMAGSAYTATWYMSLISLTSFSAISAADTMGSHAGWVEDQNYSNANRITTAWNAASAGAKALTAALGFTINATTTIKGCFITTVNTKGGTTGILYSAGLFTGGDKAVANGDTLNVSYTTTLT